MTVFWVVVAAVAAYFVHCAIWPYRRCWACSGTGKVRTPLGVLSYRTCRCGGDGQAIRWGARVWAALGRGM